MQIFQPHKHEPNRGCLPITETGARHSGNLCALLFQLHMIYQHLRFFTKWIKRKAVQSFNYFTWIFLKFKKIKSWKMMFPFSNKISDKVILKMIVLFIIVTLKIKKTHQILGRKPEICHLLSHQKNPRNRGVLPKTWKRRGCPCTCEGGLTDSGMTSSTWSTQDWIPTQAADSPGPWPQPRQVAEQSPYLWADIPCVYIYLLQFFPRIIFKPSLSQSLL